MQGESFAVVVAHIVTSKDVVWQGCYTYINQFIAYLSLL